MHGTRHVVENQWRRGALLAGMRSEGETMRLLAAALFGLALVSGGVGTAHAKGCLKGAAVGGVAGHMAGHHTVMGAAAGCAFGHHEASKDQKAQQQAQSTSDDSNTKTH